MMSYEDILKRKIEYYGETKAAYQFAAEEYAESYHKDKVKKLTIPVVMRIAYIVQDGRTLINYAIFDSREKARKYVGESGNMVISQVEIL